MRTNDFTFILCALLLLTGCKPAADSETQLNSETTSITAALTIKGNLTGWDASNATINVMGYFVEPLFSGTINSSGLIAMKLPDNFIDLTGNAFAKADSSETSGYELEIPTALETFSNTENVAFSGKNVELALAGKYYGFEVFIEDNYETTIYPASSVEFMNFTKSPENHQAVTGFNYFFVYSENAVKIKGMNTTTNLFSTDTSETYDVATSYAVNIKPGWNIVHHQIEKLTASTDAKYLVPSTVIYSTVTKLPKSLNWVSIASQKNTSR